MTIDRKPQKVNMDRSEPPPSQKPYHLLHLSSMRISVKSFAKDLYLLSAINQLIGFQRSYMSRSHINKRTNKANIKDDD